LPLAHRQTQPDDGRVEFVTEAIRVQLLPLPAQAVQYILYWYAAENVPPDVEREHNRWRTREVRLDVWGGFLDRRLGFLQILRSMNGYGRT
jgi:hypothetical protein